MPLWMLIRDKMFDIISSEMKLPVDKKAFDTACLILSKEKGSFLPVLFTIKMLSI